MASPLFLLFLCLVYLSGDAVALDKVPVKDRFKYVNAGDFADYSAEYGADYRAVSVVGSPFQLAFYNTTPGVYTLAIRMGTPRSESIRRWVWEANRGRPVGENATISFGADGNLVLAEADGTVVWSTGTANRGVVGIEILHSGNMVLRDRKGKFIWQSFDYPTDTLLVGQILPCRGASKLVSRKSEADGSPGRYSLVIDSGEPVLYIDASPKPLVYFNQSRDRSYTPGGGSKPVNFTVQLTESGSSYELRFGIFLTQTKYDSTLSLLRLTPDGDLVVYTYDDRVYYKAWQKTFTLFTAEPYTPDQCFKPGKCWPLGLCDDEMCVSCPTRKGFKPWSASGCVPPTWGSCGPGGKPNFYKLAGVENFLTRYSDGEGVVSVGECRRRCSVDCDCQGFLYWEESSRCWLAPVLGTFKQVAEPKHTLYIKYS